MNAEFLVNPSIYHRPAGTALLGLPRWSTLGQLLQELLIFSSERFLPIVSLVMYPLVPAGLAVDLPSERLALLGLLDWSAEVEQTESYFGGQGSTKFPHGHGLCISATWVIHTPQRMEDIELHEGNTVEHFSRRKPVKISSIKIRPLV